MAEGRRGDFSIDSSCIGCGACEHACPGKVDAVFVIPGDFLGRFYIQAEACINCGKCVPLCPVDCIHDAHDGEGTPARGRPSAVDALQTWTRRSTTGTTS